MPTTQQICHKIWILSFTFVTHSLTLKQNNSYTHLYSHFWPIVIKYYPGGLTKSWTCFSISRIQPPGSLPSADPGSASHPSSDNFNGSPHTHHYGLFSQIPQLTVPCSELWTVGDRAFFVQAPQLLN